MLFKLTKNWAIYTGISFLSCLATILTVTRFGIFMVLFAYAAYGFCQVYITATKLEQKQNIKEEEAMRWAKNLNSPDILYFVFAVVVGIYVGGSH